MSSIWCGVTSLVGEMQGLRMTYGDANLFVAVDLFVVVCSDLLM